MEPGAERQIVVFTLGEAAYAVGIEAVKEVVNWSRPTRVPEAPPMVEGVIDLRGDVVPVIDLAKRLKVERHRAPAEARIMVLELAGKQIGLVVDEVTEVLKIRPEQFSPPSPVTRSADDPIVQGVIKVDGRLLVLIEARQIVAGAGVLEPAPR